MKTTSTTSAMNLGFKLTCKASVVGSYLNEALSYFHSRPFAMHVVEFKTTLTVPDGSEFVVEVDEQPFPMPRNTLKNRKGLATEVRKCRREHYMTDARFLRFIRDAAKKNLF